MRVSIITGNVSDVKRVMASDVIEVLIFVFKIQKVMIVSQSVFEKFWSIFLILQ